MELRHFGFTQSVPETEGGDRRDAFRAARAELGGYSTPIAFSERERQVLNAICDEIIPPGCGFPRPSAVGVVEDFFTRYHRPQGSDRHPRFPNGSKTHSSPVWPRWGRNSAPRTMPAASPPSSGWRSSYRSSSASRVALTSGRLLFPPRGDRWRFADNHDAGRDYRGAPQPYGYEGSTMDWGDMIPPRKQAGWLPGDGRREEARAGCGAGGPTPPEIARRRKER